MLAKLFIEPKKQKNKNTVWTYKWKLCENYILLSKQWNVKSIQEERILEYINSELNIHSLEIVDGWT